MLYIHISNSFLQKRSELFFCETLERHTICIIWYIFPESCVNSVYFTVALGRWRFSRAVSEQATRFFGGIDLLIIVICGGKIFIEIFL